MLKDLLEGKVSEEKELFKGWTSLDYGSGYSYSLGKTLVLSVFWDGIRPRGSTEPPWVVKLNRIELKKQFEDNGDAKEAAIRLAKKEIGRITSDLKRLK